MAHGGEEVKRPDQRQLSAGSPVIIIIENLNVNDPSDMNKLERVLNESLGRKTQLAIRSRRFMMR